jgi:lipopolysaccharide transport system permease protein
MPLSVVITNGLKFLIQFGLFLICYLYYIAIGDTSVQIQPAVLLFPVLAMMMALLGLGFGIIFTSLTTKYRDLVFLLQFGIQLAMYATPVIYSFESVPEKYRWLMALNPMTSIIETFKYGFLGTGMFSWMYLAYTCAFIAVLLFAGTIIFNHTERSFIDTV